MTYRYPGGLVRRTAANTAITGASGVWDLGSQAQAVRNNTWPISGLANPISGSLRFRSSASAYLNRTLTTPTNNLRWTWSAWVKRGTLGTTNILFGAGDGSSDNFGSMQFRSEDTLQFAQINGGAYNVQVYTTAVFRDPSAWYHVVLVYDSPNATSTDRIQIYVNGTRQTALTYATGPFAQNTSSKINSTLTHYISKLDYTSLYFDGCMAEVNFIDGQALTPASFGQTSAITGVWEPIKYTGTYGTNGFYLSLSDTSSIGKDFSGNGNNWTPNNISTASGSTFDLMRDVPTQWAPQGVTDVGGTVRGNYATLNPLVKFNSTPTFSEGNLKITSNAVNYQVGLSTIGIPRNSGKWYWETTASGTMSSGTYSGIMNDAGIRSMTVNSDYVTLYGYGTSTYSSSAFSNNYYYYAPNTYSLYSPAVVWNNGDTVCWAYDSDNGRMWIGKNGVWNGNVSGVVGNPSTGSDPLISSIPSETWYPAIGVYQHPTLGTTAWFANFGQRPFTYTVPTGFKSLCTTNLPTPTIGATAATAANKYFDATLITGTAATQVITNAGGFQPDFVWLKSRTNANNPTIYDAIRGVNTILYPALTNAEQVGVRQLTAFNSNGFTLGSDENANDSNGEASVGWQWNAGGSTVTNTAGSISSQVRANPTAGFSIVTWTGTGTNRPSIGHGLGVAPSMIIEKGRDAGTGPYNWTVQHIGLSSWSNSLFLNNTSAENSGSGGGTAPSSTVYYAAVNNYAGENGVRYVAYCFAPVAGYSAFGKYTGNGSTDGPFVYTGFRPKFILIKNSSGTSSWYIYDGVRNTFNVVDKILYPNLTNAEETYTFGDILSNGFKIRSTDSGMNGSGSTIIYAAFAEFPFKNSLAR